eukprot:TRINITY_DN17685_c0_g1_i2.p1 TRINITY_DN17685_c0_g1~~TRINITY_DN17685_c0_g1_i2.p1  ORF type:complete len:203 (+),score=30.10 TRINITY_DN17685_c0_g1_i2:75-683(+)
MSALPIIETQKSQSVGSGGGEERGRRGRGAPRGLESLLCEPFRDEDASCAICLADFEVGERLRVVPCAGAHAFHGRCLARWLSQRRTTCPCCREDVRPRPVALDMEVAAQVLHARRQRSAAVPSTSARRISAPPPLLEHGRRGSGSSRDGMQARYEGNRQRSAPVAALADIGGATLALQPPHVPRGEAGRRVRSTLSARRWT